CASLLRATRSTAALATPGGEAGGRACFHRSPAPVRQGPCAGCIRSAPGGAAREPPGSGILGEARGEGFRKPILEVSSCAPYTVHQLLYVKQCMSSSRK